MYAKRIAAMHTKNSAPSNPKAVIIQISRTISAIISVAGAPIRGSVAEEIASFAELAVRILNR
jgi:hypothetical protein